LTKSIIIISNQGGESVSDQHAEIRQLAARVAKEIYEPMAESLDVNRTPLPKQERLRLGDLGFLGIAHPEKDGGAGAPREEAVAVLAGLARGCRPAAFRVFESTTGPAQVITHLGTEEQRARWLPDIISGRKTMAVAISEPHAGSAATDMRTTAKEVGGKLVINGTKRWISNEIGRASSRERGWMAAHGGRT